MFSQNLRLEEVYHLFRQRVDEAISVEQLRIPALDGLGSLMQHCGIKGCPNKVPSDSSVYEYIVSCRRSATLEELSKSNMDLDFFIEAAKDKLPSTLRDLYQYSHDFTEIQKLSFHAHKAASDDIQKSLMGWPDNDFNRSDRIIISARSLSPDLIAESIALIQAQDNPKISLEIRIPADFGILAQLAEQIEVSGLPGSSIALFIEGGSGEVISSIDSSSSSPVNQLLRQAETIYLREPTRPSPASLNNLTAVGPLKNLVLDFGTRSKWELGAETIDSIANPEGLRRLGLPGAQLDNTNLEKIGRLFPNLEVLDVAGSRIHVSDLVWLSSLKKLERLLIHQRTEPGLFEDKNSEAIIFYLRNLACQNQMHITERTGSRHAIYTRLQPNLPTFD